MANATFSFVGALRAMKSTDTNKSFEKKNYDSGWMTERLRFSVIAGDNRHFVEINSGRWQKEDKNVIYAFSKGDANNKGKPIQIPWNKRNDATTIDSVAGWKVFTVDLDTYGNRKKLEEEGDEEALEASNKKCHHFLAGTDFCEFVNKVLTSDKYRDAKFRVNGNVIYSYSERNDQYYVSYEVTKIYLVDDAMEPASSVNMDFYFTEDAFDDSTYDESGKATVSGYTTFYDNATKKNWFVPVCLAVRDHVAGWKKKFNKFEDEEVRKIGLVLSKIDGAQRVKVTYDDLDDETKENIDMGLISLEDVVREMGGTMMGDRVQELRIEKLGRGSIKGSEATIYTADDLTKKPVKEVVKVDDGELDIFSDDDDDDL